MKNLEYILTITLVLLTQISTAQNKKEVSDFNKVIISPHIETTFVQGDENSVTILENKLSDDIVNIEVDNSALWVYLDDAKQVTKHKKVMKKGVKMKVPIYKGKILTILVTYKNIEELSLRGEETTLCESLIDVEDFRLKIYGESTVIFNEVQFSDFDADIYGESNFTIKKGKIDLQKIAVYGEGEVDLVNVDNKISKLKAFGEATFTVQASQEIKFTSFGEASLYYKGDAILNKGVNIGGAEISHID